MATYRKRGLTWRAEVRRAGHSESATFPTKAQAVAWATQVEGEVLTRRRGGIVPRTVAQALRRYAKDVSPTHDGGDWEKVRLAKLERVLPFAGMLLEDVQPADIAGFRDAALAGSLKDRDEAGELVTRPAIAPASVRRELGLLRQVFQVAIDEWGWLRQNPMRGVKRPPPGRPRTRIYTQDEIDRIVLATGWDGASPCGTASDYVGAAFLWAVETAMRAGELLGLERDAVDATARVARLTRTKNGDDREVPLSTAAVRLLGWLPSEGPLFPIAPKSLDTLFRRARDRAGVVGATFHDARATALTRMAEQLDVLELARAVGHRDPRSLMVYYRKPTAAIARKLR